MTILGDFGLLLKEVILLEVAGAVVKIGLSLKIKPPNQVKLV